MRVLITVILHYVDGGGGSSRLAYDEALRLRDLGHEVWMLASSIDNDAPEYEYRNGIHFLRYRYKRRYALDPRRMFWYRSAIRDLLKRRAPSRFDVIHGHGPLQYMVACRCFPQAERRCFSVHSPIVDELRANVRGAGWRAYARQFVAAPFLRKIERDCLRESNWVNAFSMFTIWMMKRYHGRTGNAVQFMPGWTDLNRFKVVRDRTAAKLRLGWRTDVPVLFTLRRLVPRMGLDRLIQAASLVGREGSDFELIIGGAGPLRESLEILAKHHQISAKIKFVGRVPDEDLPLMYGACDAFILPTAELECFGIIAVEALASGRPVLATPVAAIPEILNFVEPKWLARGSRAQDIADLLRSFLIGGLPGHSSERLRALAGQHWGEPQLESYCRAVLGQNANFAMSMSGE